MAHEEMRPPALNTRNGLGICFARQHSDPKNSAIRLARQVRTPAVSTLSLDDDGLAPRTFAAWLARRGRVTLHHAAALAEAHGLGGA